jgi:hypothetical protein
MANDYPHRSAKSWSGLLLIAASLHLPLTYATELEDDDANKEKQEVALQLPPHQNQKICCLFITAAHRLSLSISHQFLSKKMVHVIPGGNEQQRCKKCQL